MTMKRMTKLERDVAMHLAVHLQPGSLLASRAAGRAKRCPAAVRRASGHSRSAVGTVPWGPVDARQQLVAVGRLWPLWKAFHNDHYEKVAVMTSCRHADAAFPSVGEDFGLDLLCIISPTRGLAACTPRAARQ